MSNAYIGVDGVARKVQAIYVGVETDVPIYETVTNTNMYKLNLTNLARFFSVSTSTGTSGWSYSDYTSGGLKLVPGNFGVDSSTATITLTALCDLINVVVGGAYYTESSYDKITLTVAGSKKLNAKSGESDYASIWTGSLLQGEKIEFKYVKDSSASNSKEKSTYFTVNCDDIAVIQQDQIITGYSKRSVARTVTKGYIGVAREFYSNGQPLGNLAIGDTIEFGTFAGKPIVWYVAHNGDDGFFTTYNMTLVSKFVIQKEFPFDAAEPDHEDNYISETGSACYFESNINTWLNSAAAEGNWFSPMTDTDVAPADAYKYLPGFLREFTNIEKDALVSKYITTSYCPGYGLPMKSMGQSKKIYLLSDFEVGLSNEGDKLALFTTSSYIPAKFTNSSTKYAYWLRSGDEDQDVRTVTTSGTLSTQQPYWHAVGVRPVCNLLNTTIVSNEPNANGNYILVV